MSQRSSKAHWGQLALALGIVLQGCAGTPRLKPTEPPAAPHAPEQVVQMAPIPNPEPVKPAPRPAPVHRPAPKVSESPSAPKAPPHPQAAVDHGKAAKLRAQGLEDLDRGQINRAVSVLQAASQLDPGDPLIQRDLDRALRISKAVHAHP